MFIVQAAGKLLGCFSVPMFNKCVASSNVLSAEDCGGVAHGRWQALELLEIGFSVPIYMCTNSLCCCCTDEMFGGSCS
ncbi:hypothetical protein SEVIR_6G116900v4 [Setaria viridis]